ncbi:MAG: alkaline phosphatase family protein, partial [Ignavibacteriaceae bacterium]
FNDLKPAGTFYNNFYITINNPAVTATMQGHTAVLTGNWEAIANDGTERPTNPTLFEYYRKYTGADSSDAYVIGGKEKLDALTFSNHSEYGQAYKASSEVTGLNNDTMIYNKLIDVLSSDHPRLTLVNFTQTDKSAHTGIWDDYIFAIHQADSLIYKLWQYIEADTFYSGNTTLLITNDHGRHDDANGGFQDHGDNCIGCRHIMLLALGPNITAGQEISELKYQIDIAPTVGEVLSFPSPYSNGTSLFSGSNPLSVEISTFSAVRKFNKIIIEWTTQSEIDNYGFEIQKMKSKNNIWKTIGFVKGNGNTNNIHQYSFIDDKITDTVYFYKLRQIDNDGSYTFSKVIKINENNIENYELLQNFPNPFNPSTSIQYSVSSRQFISLKIYNILGNEVAVLVNKEQQPGNYEVEFSTKGRYGSDRNAAQNSILSSSVYFYRLQAGSFISTKKMLMIK